jgi:hypothetical protein
MESEAVAQKLRVLEERLAMPSAQSAPVPIVQTASALSKLAHTFSLPRAHPIDCEFGGRKRWRSITCL